MEISVHVTEGCNLNCKSCFHMIPLAEDYYYYIEGYLRRNFELLSQHRNIVDTLNIMGGEPTLHPYITSILYVAREHFPNTKLVLATNGTNLEIFRDEFFIKAIQRTNIQVSITGYPYSSYADENYKKLCELLKANNIEYRYNKINKFMVQPFHKDLINDITKKQWCKSFHYCVILKDCKLYVCHLAAYVDRLKRNFPELDWINIDENAYVDLKDTTLTDKTILEKLSKLSLICEHCAELNRGWTSSIPGEMEDWARSNKEKKEWVKE